MSCQLLLVGLSEHEGFSSAIFVRVLEAFVEGLLKLPVGLDALLFGAGIDGRLDVREGLKLHVDGGADLLALVLLVTGLFVSFGFQG